MVKFELGYIRPSVQQAAALVFVLTTGEGGSVKVERRIKVQEKRQTNDFQQLD